MEWPWNWSTSTWIWVALGLFIIWMLKKRFGSKTPGTSVLHKVPKAIGSAMRSIFTGSTKLARNAGNTAILAAVLFLSSVLIVLTARMGWWTGLPGSDNGAIAALWLWIAHNWGVILIVTVFAAFIAGCCILFKKKTGWVLWTALIAIAALTILPSFRAGMQGIGHNRSAAYHSSVAQAGPARSIVPETLTNDDFDCNGAHPCQLAFDASGKTDIVVLQDRYHRTGTVHVCVTPEMKEQLIYHLWDGDEDLGKVTMTHGYTDASWENGQMPARFDQVSFELNGEPHDHMIYWFTRSQDC